MAINPGKKNRTRTPANNKRRNLNMMASSPSNEH